MFSLFQQVVDLLRILGLYVVFVATENLEVDAVLSHQAGR
jgi:hypothetical protein